MDFFYLKVPASALVQILGWFSVKEKRNYFMSVIMYRSLTSNAPVYLCDHSNDV